MLNEHKFVENNGLAYVRNMSIRIPNSKQKEMLICNVYLIMITLQVHEEMPHPRIFKYNLLT